MSFYLRNKPAAYDVDQTSGTTPVWQQLANLDQAKSNYGAIVYNKAPGILKQLNYLVGDSAFRAGVHDFLIAHAYGNATWQDLLGVDRRRRRTARSPTGEAQYILRPGMPVLEQRLDIADGKIKRLTLIQHPAQSALRAAACGRCAPRSRSGRSGTASQSLPVEIRAETTVVAAAAGHARARLRLRQRERQRLRPRDARSAKRRLARRRTSARCTIRFSARCSGARCGISCATRGSRRRTSSPPRLRELPARAGRADRVGDRVAADARDVGYLSAEQQRARDRPTSRHCCSPARPTRTRATACARASSTRTSASRVRRRRIARLTAWLDSTSTAGLPLRQPTRWSIVDPSHRARRAERRRAAGRRDRGATRRRTASAARSSPAPRGRRRR